MILYFFEQILFIEIVLIFSLKALLIRLGLRKLNKIKLSSRPKPKLRKSSKKKKLRLKNHKKKLMLTNLKKIYRKEMSFKEKLIEVKQINEAADKAMRAYGQQRKSS